MSPPTKLVDGRFEIEQKLGSGCFGQVYKAKEVSTGNIVAVKFSGQDDKDGLITEAEVLRRVGQPPSQGYASLYAIISKGPIACLVVEMLGKSLQDCMDDVGKNKVDAISAALCGQQILLRIELLHSKGIVHRDIKPENFLVGVGKKAHHVYIIDFGLSTEYYKQAQHVTQGRKEQMTGTARYTSINAMKGVTQSRRDDLEAIGHMLLYFVRGRLPWSGLEAPTDVEKFRRICETKESIPLDTLCEGHPDEFKQYLQYTRALEFTQKPDYGMLRGLMQKVRNNSADHDFEWLRNKNYDASTAVALEGLPPGCHQPDEQPPPSNTAPEKEKTVAFASGPTEITAPGDKRQEQTPPPAGFCCCRRRAPAAKDIETGKDVTGLQTAPQSRKNMDKE
jgi:serine/threonine protein kinase